jgi:hypothetical protein
MGYTHKIRKWYHDNVSTDVPPFNEIAELTDKSDGEGVKIKFLIENHPDKEAIDAIDNATAIAYCKGVDDLKKVDFDKWSPQERVLLKFLIKHLNKHRTDDGKPAFTRDQIDTALLEELNS